MFFALAVVHSPAPFAAFVFGCAFNFCLMGKRARYCNNLNEILIVVKWKKGTSNMIFGFSVLCILGGSSALCSESVHFLFAIFTITIIIIMIMPFFSIYNI